MAVWQGGLGSLSWIRALTATADGEDLGGGGYPVRFTARAAVLDAPVRNGPPEAKEVWSSDVGDVIDFAIWPGRTVVDEVGLAECDPNEWLLIEAWDES